MGYIRFLLAVIVVMAHVNAPIVPSIRALGAVQVFFVISGFYMAATYEKNYGGDRAAMFWASRFLRLYPTYVVVLVLTWLTWLALGPRAGSGGLHVFDYFANPGPKPHLAVWTLLFQDLVSADESSQSLLPVRQAWSISAELAFYALVPALVRWRKWALPIALASFALKATLYDAAGWRYAYFPFFSELGYFVLGLWVFYLRSLLTWSRSMAVMLAIAFCGYVLLSGPGGWEESSTIRNAALVAATLIMLPSCFAHLNGRLSNILGDLSYGTYIAQFLALEILLDLRIIDVEQQGMLSMVGRFLAVLALSAGVSALIEAFVQTPIDRWRRRRLRSVPAATPGTAAALLRESRSATAPVNPRSPL